MIEYNQQPQKYLEAGDTQIASFVSDNASNIDWETVESFGEEWTKFSSFSTHELEIMGNDYFDIISQEMLNKDCLVLDVGCGTGRWTKFVGHRCGFIEAIDPSSAVISAAALLREQKNIRISHADVNNLPFADASFDFVFSLGVLHHIPDTREAMQKCVEKLKPGGHFMVYLYYDFENKGLLFKSIYHASNLIRLVVSRLPATLKKLVCDFLALTIYLPMAFLTRLVKRVFGGTLYEKLPISWYHDKTFNIMRNDSLDRFGTPLEQRYSRADIIEMMTSCSLTDIKISDIEPLWHAVGKKS